MISKPKEFIDNKTAEKITNFVDFTIGSGIIERLGRKHSKDMIRFRPVAEACKKARDFEGMTIKQIAAQLKIPQYRLRSIEESNLRYIRLNALELYIDFLDMCNWFNLWVCKNKSVYNRLKKR